MNLKTMAKEDDTLWTRRRALLPDRRRGFLPASTVAGRGLV
jgi:hypothetical protein